MWRRHKKDLVGSRGNSLRQRVNTKKKAGKEVELEEVVGSKDIY